MNKLVDDFMSGDSSVVLTGAMLDAVKAEIERLRKAADQADGAWNGLMQAKETYRKEAHRIAQENANLIEWEECFKFIDLCDLTFLAELLVKHKRHDQDSQTGIWIEVVDFLRAKKSGERNVASSPLSRPELGVGK